MRQHKLFGNFAHRRATKAQVSLRICIDSPEASLLKYTANYGCGNRLNSRSIVIYNVLCFVGKKPDSSGIFFSF